MSELVFKHKGGYVLFEADVINTFTQWKQTGDAPEAGGILIGFRRGPHIHITSCTEPQKLDKCTRFGFHRKSKFHQEMATKYWRRTNGHAYYVGDWHTHPVPNPTPSLLDKIEWKKLSTTMCDNRLLFVIVGTEENYVRLGKETLRADS